MARHYWVGAFAPAAVLICLFSTACTPADAAGPAVSAANGKIEFDAGALSVPSSFVGRIAGTLTVPIGDQFGIQADVSGGTAGGATASAAFHLFTRDPQSYLFGGTLGLIRTPGASVVAAGPEAELYFGQWTVEAWGGVALTRPSSGPDRTGAFGMADLAYYPQPNLRFSAGLSLLDGFAALHVGGEYLFDETVIPLSLTGDARVGQDGWILATIGLRGYFGALHKTLIDRHREDDPWDRGTSLLTAIGRSTASGSPTGDTQPPGAQQQEPSGPKGPEDCGVASDWFVIDGKCVRAP
jgi:hypothetical protein